MKHIFQRTHNKIVSIMIAFDAGGRAEINGYTPGIAHMLEHMIFKGTENRSYLDIPREVAFLGGSINAFTSHEMVMFYIDIPYENFEEGMEILADIVHNSTFPEEEFLKEKEVVLEEALSYKDEPTYPLSIRSQKEFFSGRLSTPLIGTEEDIKSFTRDELVRFYNEFYNADSSILAITGDIPLEEMERTSQKLYGPPSDFVKQTELQPHNYREAREVFVSSPGMEQAHVWLMYPGLTIGDEDSTNFHILKSILGSGMDSRLFTEVREKNNLCYGVGVTSSSHYEVGDVMIYSSTRMENVDKMLSLVDREVEKIKNEFVTDEELERAKNKTRATIYSIYDSGTSLTRRRLNEAFYNIPTIEEISSKIESVTKEDIQRVANKVFNNEFKMQFVLGDKKDVVK